MKRDRIFDIIIKRICLVSIASNFLSKHFHILFVIDPNEIQMWGFIIEKKNHYRWIFFFFKIGVEGSNLKIL